MASQRTILYFDEMNILNSEKERRINASDDLETRLNGLFEGYRERITGEGETGQDTFRDFTRDLLLAMLLWAIGIEYISKADVQENVVELYEKYGLNAYKNILKNDYSYSGWGVQRNAYGDLPKNDHPYPSGRTATQIPHVGGSSASPKTYSAVGEQGFSGRMNHITNSVDNISQSTQAHAKTPYYTSEDRAFNIATDETNSAFNEMAHEEAAKKYTRHRWRTMRDGRERKDHRNADGQTRPINVPFTVGGYQMMYPMDDSLGAPIEQIANCRCVEEFL